MSNPFYIHYYPVFEKGIFEKHSALFDRFMQNTPHYLKKEYQKARETLPRYEETITWPLIVGTGFWGATHPGAENIFVTAMVAPSYPIYNSDCLYINPSWKLFAISDAPGMTACSRRLFSKLDYYLRTGSFDDLETIINNLNKETRTDDGATLSLICFPENKLDSRFSKALAFVAGDSFLFHGNLFQGSVTRIEGVPEFIGTPYIHLEPKHIELVAGDFFVIASDGILSIKTDNEEARLEEIILEHVNGDLENFTLNAFMNCNRCIEERIYDRVITRFGGSDNVSALLVYPEQLVDIDGQESFILGGEMTMKNG